MNMRVQLGTSNIDWNEVSKILTLVDMGDFDAEIRKKAFENSHTVIFVFDDDKLIGFGRAIADGAYEAAIYDVAILPEYQGKGIGRIIIEGIKNNIPQCNVILYASPGKEKFYEKMNFKKMQTGMAIFVEAEIMQKKGFIE